jgi:hypothetical protein
VNPAALLYDLRRRGVELSADADRLRYRAPRGVLSPDLLADLRAHKSEVLAELARGQGEFEADAQFPEAGPPGAVLVDSPRFGEVWVALTDEMAVSLQDEEQRREAPRPVLVPEDLARLQGRSQEAIRAVLNVVAVFPGARIADE